MIKQNGRLDFSSFDEVDAWIFDLDNTLYPAHSDLFPQIIQKINTYVQRLTGKPSEEAHELQREYYKTYGTTLRGLMTEHDISPDEFLEYVHDIDHSCLEPDERLGQAIQSLPGRRFILTNGTKKHAEAVASKLGITHHFEDIFGIVEADLVPKPAHETYNKFITQNRIDPASAVMFEDLARNLEVPHLLGMRTVLVVPEGTREVFREDWELEGAADPHVEFVTDNLGEFLAHILSLKSSGG
ncbi:pyrimidine 5'-nucleotidase [Pseudovibrio exalbescens]|uniref:pyrimidine 5'-nucleotidase n=1 Tax=Pseudovibrio exalbescens TaxID=197461 RepID=UPI002365DE72|nr:pyrimidine 5'-nucleotidase [Pseudovibrio exalbescens]MDD7910109.1 pyrimidine 5'-nucleotidase [Pseudovibrio exalbescens]